MILSELAHEQEQARLVAEEQAAAAESARLAEIQAEREELLRLKE